MPDPDVPPADAPAGPDPAEPTVLDRLLRAAGELAELRVVTAVGEVAVTLEQQDGASRTRSIIDTAGAPIATSIVTLVDMVDGDVVTVIHPDLRDDAALWEIHRAQVEQSLEVLPANLARLAEVAATILDRG